MRRMFMNPLAWTFTDAYFILTQDAGLTYKNTIKADLLKDARVAEVIDVGVNDDDHTAYAHVAVSAAKKVASGELDRAILICGTGLGSSILNRSNRNSNSRQRLFLRCRHCRQQSLWSASGYRPRQFFR